MKNLFILLVIISITTIAAAQTFRAKALISDTGHHFMQPRFSPDGTMLAFTEQNYSGIWIAKSDGSKPRQITTEPAAGYQMQWSQDSRTLLSRVAKFENHRRYNAVKLFDVVSGDSKLLTDFITLMPGIPHWTPENDKVIYPGKKKLRKTASGKTANPSNSIPVVCFTYKDQLVISKTGTENFTYLNPLPGKQYLNPVVSYDGSRIAFETVGGSLFVMYSDGSGLQELGMGYRPRFSPDGKQLVFMVAEDDGHRYLSSDIYITGIDGTGRTNITNTDDRFEMNPDWSPTEDVVVFDALYEGVIYQMDLR